MSDPVTLTTIGVPLLTEGIKFLYEQAGEVLKRWRERKDASKENKAVATAPQPIQIVLPPIFEGQLMEPQIHFEAVEWMEEQLRGLRKELSDYATGVELIDPTDSALLQQIDALRQGLEAIFQQRLTLKGEQRPASGPLVGSRIDVETVAGYVAAVRAQAIQSGQVRAEVQAKRVESGGQIVGVEIGTLGGEEQ